MPHPGCGSVRVPVRQVCLLMLQKVRIRVVSEAEAGGADTHDNP
jgi:hypothetical protein